ncbi:MAG: GNAT family N-acetyltransferase, partial [Nocardioidaceae bacterium]
MADRLTTGVSPWRDGSKVTDAVRGWVDSSIGAAAGKDGAMFVAEASGVVTGFVSVTQQTHWTGEADGYIGELVVRADREGRGLGGALVAAAEQWARDRGLARIRLATGAANHGALRFNDSLG